MSVETMSVREKKGKKKKKEAKDALGVKKKVTKDRWGAKIPTCALEEENHEEAAPAVAEPQQNSNSTDVQYEPNKVFVGGMPYTTTEDDIHYYFGECGEIAELDCMTFPDTGNFRGIAFITFKTEEGAKKALEYDNTDMGGRYLKIEKCKLKPQAEAKNPERGEVQKTVGCTSAYIGNLSWDVTEDVIKSFFKKSYSKSKIDAIRLQFDKITGDFKGFGHMDFGDDESLEAAVKLNQEELLGRPMKIAYSVPPKHVNGGSTNSLNSNSSQSKKGGACYNCGEEGHKSFLCPKNGKSGSGNRKSGACFNCGEEGHKSFLCPKNGKST